jgi:putative phosphoribosyl transferase
MYLDRRDAGRRLAAALLGRNLPRPLVVLGLPRGGVPVAFEVARALDAALDVLVVRKIGAPGNPELAIGALAGEGPPEIFLDHAMIRRLGIPEHAVAATIRAESVELRRRADAYRRGFRPLEVRGRTVVVVDDGLATGATARAALRWLARAGAGRRILAVPVAPPSAVEALSGEADLVVALATPASFAAVGGFYADFGPTSDAEVRALLSGAWRASQPG